MPARRGQHVGVSAEVRAHLHAPTLGGREPAVEEDSLRAGKRRARIMFLMQSLAVGPTAAEASPKT
jgi:hypothetical protein